MAREMSRPDADLPDTQYDSAHKPLTEAQERSEHKHSALCRESGQVDCNFEADGADLDEVKDSLMRHYIDAHPGHKVDDAYMLTLSERYRA